MIHAFTVITHALHLYYSLLSEHPSQQIRNYFLVAVTPHLHQLVAEKMKRTNDHSSGIIQALNSSGESDSGSCFQGLSGIIILSEGGWFCLD